MLHRNVVLAGKFVDVLVCKAPHFSKVRLARVRFWTAINASPAPVFEWLDTSGG